MTAPSIAERPAAYSAGELAEYGYSPGARVGSCIHVRRYGTIMSIANAWAILVRWDDDQCEIMSWAQIASLGYLVWAL